MLPALIIAVTATLAAVVLWATAGGPLTALEWSVYDRWLRARVSSPPSPSPVIIVRDAAAEAQLGKGSWDRGVLARVIVNLNRAGAAAIGADVPVGEPGTGAAGRGGATGDALLTEATAMAATVVYPIALEPGATPAGAARPGLTHPSWRDPVSTWPEATPLAGVDSLPGFALHAKAVGHTLAVPDRDGVVRRLPLFVRVGERAVPAFGLALGAVFLGVAPEQIAIERDAVVLRPPSGARALRIPVDARGRALVPFGVSALPAGVKIAPFSEVWSAIESRQTDALQALVDDRLVLVLAEPAHADHATPGVAMSASAMQAHVLAALLAGVTVHELPVVWSWLVALGFAIVAASFWLSLPWWAALAGTLILVSAHGTAVVLGLTRAGVVIPITPPLVALVAASATALAWHHFASIHRLRRLETENARAQEALVRHESVVESLEEDLDAARAAVARSTGAERDLVGAADALRAQVAEARTQEATTRRRLAELEQELHGLRPVRHAPAATGYEEDGAGAEAEALGIVTRDPAVFALVADLKKGARASLPILLLGEPGTGKELFARAAHRLSARAGHPFVPVNMAAISPELFESELFGHVKGSFTGAIADRKGYFAEADGGTLLLDEIGELRPEHQVKLLRVLQEKTFHRVGASRPTTVDVRVIAASNRDLERGAAEGWFREDLYFRLKGLVLRLPPLRERAGDVPLLATRLFADIAEEVGRETLTLSAEAVEALQAHDWPGNVREMQNVLRQAATLADGPVVTARDLRLTSRPRPALRAAAVEPALDATSDASVLTSLRKHRFDMQATGRELGWDRSTVTQRLKGLGFRALVEAEGDRGKAALALAGDTPLARTVELKLREYHEHLLRSVEGYDSADAAVVACRRRFKNLPERHFRFLEVLVRQHFTR